VIFRCPECYVAILSLYGGSVPSISYVRSGTLDRKDIIRPDAYIYTSTKQPWVVLDKDTPTFEGPYKYREVWPKEAQERLEAARLGTS
jgi:hypothetical protein